MDVYKDKDSLYVVEEFWEGGSLFQKLQEDGGTFREQTVTAIVTKLLQVIKVLRYVQTVPISVKN